MRKSTAEIERKTFYDKYWVEIRKFKKMRQKHLDAQLSHLEPKQAEVFDEIFGDVVLGPLSIPFVRLPSQRLRTIDFKPPPAFDLSESDETTNSDEKKSGTTKR